MRLPATIYHNGRWFGLRIHPLLFEHSRGIFGHCEFWKGVGIGLRESI